MEFLRNFKLVVSCRVFRSVKRVLEILPYGEELKDQGKLRLEKRNFVGGKTIVHDSHYKEL